MGIRRLKLQIPYYHPLNLWLLGATNGNGQAVIHLQCSDYQPLIMGIRPQNASNFKFPIITH